MEFKISFNMATVNPEYLSKSGMIEPDFESVVHFVVLSAMQDEQQNSKAYKDLMALADKQSEANTATAVQKIRENPGLFGITDLDTLAKGLKAYDTIQDIKSDLSTDELQAGKGLWNELSKDGDRILVYAYAYTAYRKVVIPAFLEDTPGLKNLATLISDFYQKSESQSLKLVTEKVEAFFKFAFTKQMEVFPSIKLAKKDLPSEVILNLCAKCAKGAKTDKEDGTFSYSYVKNRKKIASFLTEAFAMCLVTKLDTLEIEPEKESH